MKFVFFLFGEYIAKVGVESVTKKSRGRAGDVIIPSQFSNVRCFGTGEEEGSVLIALSEDGKLYKKDISLISMNEKFGLQVAEIKELFDIEESIPNFVQLSIVKKEIFDSNNTSFIFATQQGLVKKTLSREFSRSKVIAIGLNDGDKAVGFIVSDENKDSDIFLFSSAGNLCRINSSAFRSMSRIARGSYGMDVKEDSKIVSISSNLNGEDLIWTICSKGKGKVSSSSEIRAIGKGKKVGIKIHKVTENTGPVVSACLIKESDEVLIAVSGRKIMRLDASEINLFGRSCEGVRLISISGDSEVVSALKI